jgi:hypothetical protein
MCGSHDSDYEDNVPYDMTGRNIPKNSAHILQDCTASHST